VNHEEAWNLLGDYVDHDLPESKAAEVEAHLRECETCRREVRQIQALIAKAGALPRAVEPERDLWAGISSRIRPERSDRVGWTARLRSLLEPGPKLWPVAVPVAAALLVLVVVFGRRGPVPPGPVGPGPVPAVQTAGLTEDSSRVSDAVIGALEAESRQADAELARSASQAGGIENVPILGLIVENARIIDRSITELKEAWQSNPDSPRAARMLAAAYRAKIVLLGRAGNLTAES
jgi:anti-sigma factor RsiW